jgi:hypothetical protein
MRTQNGTSQNGMHVTNGMCDKTVHDTQWYVLQSGTCYYVYGIAIKWYMLLNSTSQNGINYQAVHLLNGTQYKTSPPQPMD